MNGFAKLRNEPFFGFGEIGQSFGARFTLEEPFHLLSPISNQELAVALNQA